MDNYTIYHLHSDISNLTAGTGADSITKYYDYISRAKELGMNSMAISEHGSVMNWIKKKETMEKAGLKYIHANEVYLTRNIDKEVGLVRDNFHYMLLAKNYDGVLELNDLTSKSYDRNDGHFYYNPRISFDELKATSDNIIMTSACLASPLWRMYCKTNSLEEQGKIIEAGAMQRELDEMLQWMTDNKTSYVS
jgi:DNA polymerase-3 subunit alpha